MKCVTEKEAYGMLTRMDKDELLNCMVFHMMEDGSELHCKVKDCPQISIGNMAAVPVIQLDVTDKKEIREIAVTKEMCAVMGIAPEQLIRQLQDNTAKQAIAIENIMDTMQKRFNEKSDEKVSLYLATNYDFYNGASVLCASNFFDKAVEAVKGSFYLLPSSRHELLLLPESEIPRDIDPSELTELVKEVNACKCVWEDRLTDQAYHFDAEQRKLEKVENYQIRKDYEAKRMMEESKESEKYSRKPERSKEQENRLER